MHEGQGRARFPLMTQLTKRSGAEGGVNDGIECPAKNFDTQRIPSLQSLVDELRAGRLQLNRRRTVKKLIDDPTRPGLETHTVKPGKYYWEAYINDGDRLIYRPEGRHLKVVDFVKHDDI